MPSDPDTTITSPQRDEESDPKEETPKTKPCPTFLGVCRQRLTQWADPGKMFLGRDPDGRF